MIIPSIDLMNGQAVQLIGGKELAIEAGDAKQWMQKFSLVGDVAVIDLDAALGNAYDNKPIIEALIREGNCRVGGGIRSYEQARYWLDAGAARIIIGTAATPELLSQLPRERVMAALDAEHGEVVVKGWTTKTGKRIEECMRELDAHVSGYLITFVEREGRLAGVDLEEIERLISLTTNKITFAGGVTTAAEVAAIDKLGADAQVGMALYSGRFSIADALIESLVTDREDGLFPTIVADELGVALGLCYSSRESLVEALASRQGVYFSRKRGIWRKGETSGATQELIGVRLDCDRDALLFRVRQAGSGFCHLATDTCFGEYSGLLDLEQTLRARLQSAPEGSYAKRLFDDTSLLNSKLSEEARELAEAETASEVLHEAADTIFFALTKMTKFGVSLANISDELMRRSRRITRRKGDAK